jgi:hypothetical protein
MPGSADPTVPATSPGLFFRHAGHRYGSRWLYTCSFIFIQFFRIQHYLDAIILR